MPRIARLPLLLVAAAAAALTLAGAALADRQPVRFNAADQAAARAAVLKKTDFAGVAGWKGGATKPDFAPEPCAGYEPKSSDLLVTGAASSRWTHASGLAFYTEAWVMETAAMVKLDWRRVVERSGYLACTARAEFANDATMKFVSFKRTPFPKLAPLARRYRILVDYVAEGDTVRLMFDVLLLGKGRTELTLGTVAPYAARRTVEAAELRLARMLLARTRA